MQGTERIDDVAEAAKLMRVAMVNNGFKDSDAQSISLKWMETQYNKYSVYPNPNPA